MIGIVITAEAHEAIVACLTTGARLFELQRLENGGYRIWLPKKACDLLFSNRRPGEDISSTILRVADAWREVEESKG